MSTDPTSKDIKEAVKRGYAAALFRSSGCCSSGSAANGTGPQSMGYTVGELASLPQGLGDTCFGCGNPLASDDVKAGEVILDIGSGAGMDCILAAARVGPEGRVIGLDMTPAMVERGNENARKAGTENVEFRLGEADAMPVEDASVDLVISNCVINLAPDKPRVFQEVARTLKPGGRVSISDIVFADALPELPKVLRANMDLVVACIGGAIRENEYLQAMRSAGLVDLAVVERHNYGDDQISDALTSLAGELGGGERLNGFTGDLAQEVKGKVWSVRITARKPLPGEDSERLQLARDLEIVPATAGDVATIAELLATCDLPAQELDRHPFLVARVGDRIVGCVGLERHRSSALLRSLAVHPEYRSRGVAGRLGQAILERARSSGAEQAVILTTTVNEWATRHGFIAVSRDDVDPALAASWEWQADCCASATCMVRRLGDEQVTPSGPILPTIAGPCCSG